MLMNEGGHCEGGTRRGWRHGSQATCHLHAICITHRVRGGRTAAGPASGYIFRDAVIGANRLLGQVCRHARAPIDSRAACTAPAARLGCTGAVVGVRHPERPGCEKVFIPVVWGKRVETTIKRSGTHNRVQPKDGGATLWKELSELLPLASPVHEVSEALGPVRPDACDDGDDTNL